MSTSVHTCLLVAALLLAPSLPAQEPGSGSCEPLLTASTDRPAWPGIVVDVPTGDTLIVQLRDLGRHSIRLAGLCAPKGAEPLAVVSRFNLTRLARGLRVFVVLDSPGRPWPETVTALVEDFTQAQLAAGMGQYVPEEEHLLGAYVACLCGQAEEQARRGKRGIWAP